MGDEEQLKSEIEMAKTALRGNIEKRTREAEEALDKVLSKKDMEFCSRCGRKVEGRMDWGGRCLGKGCENLVCNDCWLAKKRRFCIDHYKQMVKGKPEEEAKEKVFFKEEVPKGEGIRPELGMLGEGKEQKELREKMESLAKNYASFLGTRFKSHGALDFNPGGYFKEPRMDMTIKGDELWIRLFTKGFLRSKDRLMIVVKPICAENANYLVAKVMEQLRGMYSIIVLVGENSPSATISYVDTFDNKQVSLFLVEPGKNLLYFKQNSMNKLYSVWLDSSKNPLSFKGVLESIADRVSNRWVVSARKTAESFGYGEGQAEDVLKHCKFLSTVPDTDQYLFKEE